MILNVSFSNNHPSNLLHFINTHTRAGYGGLALSVEGPSKVDIQTEDMEDGTCKVTYCPTEPGNYFVSIRFAEEPIPGKCLLLRNSTHASAKSGSYVNEVARKPNDSWRGHV